MPKIQFSDVTPPERRSIRDIPIPQSGKRKVPIIIKPGPASAPKMPEPMRQPVAEQKSETLNTKEAGAYEYYYPKKEPEEVYNRPSSAGKSSKKRKQFIFGGLALTVIIVFVVSMMTIFASATVLVTPKSQDIDVSLNLIGATEASDESIRYEIIKLSKEQSISVPATSEEAVEIKAKGKIMIYNNFSFESQRLITRTRFESPEGLIYRIAESVNVPGKIVKDGAETPGSVEVEVFADEAGEKYNIKKTDFTIPGFKNDPARFKGFYARSVTNMEGGFVGKMKTVSESEKKAVLQNIDTETSQLIEKEIRSKIPDGLVLLPGTTIYTSTDLPQKEDSGLVVFSKEGTTYAIMLNAQDLSNKIITEYMANYAEWQGIKAAIIDFSGIKVIDKPDKIEPGAKIDFQITGKVKVLAEIDSGMISQRLAGIPKKETTKLVDEFAGIDKLTTIVRPIWKRSFPENPSKIHIETTYVK